MHATFSRLSAALAGLLFLAACGQEHGDGKAQEPGSARTSGGQECGAGLSSSPAVSATPAGEETDGVAITDADGTGKCVTFRVTNRAAEPYTYDVTFELLSGSGAAPELMRHTVWSVGPRLTVTGTVDLNANSPGTPRWSSARIKKVRSVPVAEVPVKGGRCPASGVRLYADDGDAAMGLRVVTLHLENCGTGTYRVHGYPRVLPLSEDHQKPNGVRVLHNGSAIASDTGADGPPEPLALKPGQSAIAGLVWRNTVLSGTPVNAPYVRVWARPGAAPVTVTPELDLGTTGKLAVGPWKKAA